MTTPRHILAALAFSLLVATACGDAARNEAADSPESAATRSTSLRVMSFNIEWGGAHIRFESVAEAIQAARADIVGIQEAEGNLQRLASDLGWYYNARNYVISKYPIIDPPGADGKYVYVEVRPGEIVAMANVHLPSDPYGPDWLRDGHTTQEVLALERSLRLPKIEPYLSALPKLAARGIPVFLSGDFNAPSHTDWTEDMVGTRPFVDRAFEWPVSRAVAAAGFRDSFRDVFPDPVTHPGLTWWAKRGYVPGYNPGEGEPQDRIDFLWYAGPATVIDSEIVGEAEADWVAIPIMPWPTDHRGVVSSFDVAPARLPAFVAAHRRVLPLGDRARILYYEPGLTAGEIVVSVSGEPPREVARIAIDAERGKPEISGDALPPGAYQVALLDAEGRTLQVNDFEVFDPASPVSVAIAASRFAVGDPLPVRWSNGPGNRNDYLAVFAVDAPRNSEDSMTWTYVDARSAGALSIGPDTTELGWPIPSGRYVVRLVADDGYEPLAESQPFTIE